MKKIGKQMLAICLAIILFVGQVTAATTYQANRSTFIDGTNPAIVQEKHREMIIKAVSDDKAVQNREGIIGFALPNEDYSGVNKATLRLYLTKADGVKKPYTVTQASIVVFGFDADWDEKAATWENAPDFSGEVKAGQSNLPETINEWVEVDVTDYFKQRISQSTDLSFHVKGDAMTDAYLKFAGAKHSNRPELVLEKGVTPTPPKTGNSPVVASEVLIADQSAFIYGNEKNGADQNNSANATLIVKYATNNNYRRDGLIGFSIPSEDYSDVVKATLKVYVTKADVKAPKKPEDAGVDFYGFTGKWDAKTVTWNHQPAYEKEMHLGESKATVQQWSEIDITDFFKANSGESTLSFRLQGDKNSEAYLNIVGAVSGNKPQIILERTGAIPTPPQSGDTQVDVDVDNVKRMVSMDENDMMLKSLYINEKDADKNRDKTDTVLVGQEYSAYFYSDEVKVQNPDSAFFRFFVKEDYKEQPIPVEIWGVKNPSEIGQATGFHHQPELEAAMIYELNVTNKGWYSVDVSDYVKKHNGYGFYLKAKDRNLPIVKIASYNSEKTPVLYTSKGKDEFEELREKFGMKKGNYDLSDPQVKALIQRVDDRVDSYLAKRNMDTDPSCVFWDYPLSKDKSGKDVNVKKAADNMRNSYVWLNSMLRAYHTYGSKYENDSQLYQFIKDGLELLYQKRYNPFTPENGNWWQWEIGTPKVLGEMIVTMYDDLSPETRMNYLNAIYRFQPNPEMSYYNRNSADPKEALPPQKSVGANRVDTCIGGLLLGIASKNPELIQHSIDALHDVYQYVTVGDGFYKDGSFVQHKNIAYTTAYGMVLINGLTDINNKTGQSRWKITDPDYQNVYAWLENSFIPMVFDGQALPIVAGRSLSRQGKDSEVGVSFADGYRVARMLYVAAQGAPADKKDKWLSLARRFMEKNHFYDVKANATSVGMLTEYENLQAVDMAAPYIGSHVFANMDRVVHHRNDYAVALAMYSSRIQNFEMMNGENLKGWNQGNGTLYLLNADSGQYDDAFWPTVNSHRLAGTTVDKVSRSTEDNKEEFTMASDFVGGTSLDNLYSTAAMALEQPQYRNITNYRTTLQAKKSWFFFDDEVIALGSGIHSTDDRDIETIVENRMIREDASNQVLINGNAVLANPSVVKEDFADVSWAYLEGSKAANAGIGYYFPEPITLSAIKQTRTGSWKEINTKGSADVIRRNYVTMWFDHGKNPVDATYSYALLPSKTPDEVKAYAQAPQYEVRKNTAQVQAVYEKNLGILAANVFDSAAGDLGEVKVDSPSSLMVQLKDGKLSLSISDPTMKLKTPITLELGMDKEITITEKSSHIKVLSQKPLKLEISLKDSKGAAATLHGTYQEEKQVPQPEAPQPKDTVPSTPYVPNISDNTGHTNVTKEKDTIIQDEKAPETIVPQEKPELQDISESWAKTEITELFNQEIIKGYPDQTFRPENPITRAEVAQILSNMMDHLQMEKKGNIAESNQPWYYPAMQRVKAAGWMMGDEKGDFLPNLNITRQDMFTILGRFGQWKMSDQEVDSVLGAFSDSQEISDYAKPYIAQMVKMGLIKGENGKLQPKQAISREEMAVIIYRALKAMK